MSEEEAENTSAPKLFISYRWSSPQHEDWVLKLATSLRESGVDAILDKWHLKEGQDTLAFMESMVSDPCVQKVLMICDAGYTERANQRVGGVGTEAQIISAKVYESVSQDKFAAVVVEVNADGKPLLPNYMSNRLYFDMSSERAEAANFEKIVRWVFGEPFHALPPLGEKPSFLKETYRTGSPLYRVSKRTGVPLGGSTPSTGSFANSILNDIADEAVSFRQTLVDKADAEELVYDGIAATRPVAENMYSAFRDIILSKDVHSAIQIHRFFERLLTGWEVVPHNGAYSRWDNDVYRYFTHDAFVSFVAIAMQERAFSMASDVLSMPFFKPKSQDVTGEAASYAVFRPYIESLESRNKKQNLRRLSLHADILTEHHQHSLVDQTYFMEADLTLYLRSLIAPKFSWYPISAIYLAYTYGALPTYVRASSVKAYEDFKPLLFSKSADELRQIIITTEKEDRGLRFEYRSLELSQLTNAKALATIA